MKIRFILLLLSLSSCIYDPGDGRLKVINRTKHQISLNYNVDTVPKYPSINHTEYYLSKVILPNDTLSVAENDVSWPRAIRNSINKKLNLFIYNVDSLKKYSDINALIKKRIYKRFQFSEEELTKLNWRITVRN